MVKVRVLASVTAALAACPPTVAVVAKLKPLPLTTASASGVLAKGFAAPGCTAMAQVGFVGTPAFLNFFRPSGRNPSVAVWSQVGTPRWNVEIIADAFNLFNRFNVSDVNPVCDPADPSACQAGRPTAALEDCRSYSGRPIVCRYAKTYPHRPNAGIWVRRGRHVR